MKNTAEQKAEKNPPSLTRLKTSCTAHLQVPANNMSANKEYEIFTKVQAYNNQPNIKISPQLDNRNSGYELIIEKYRSKATAKNVY